MDFGADLGEGFGDEERATSDGVGLGEMERLESIIVRGERGREPPGDSGRFASTKVMALTLRGSGGDIMESLRPR
jgi:hypothetical protein